MEHATPAAPGTETAHEAHAEHITSWAPIIIALAVPFLYIAILYPKVGLPIGLPILAVGLGWWIREDVRRFAKVANAPAVHRPGPWLGVALFIGTEVLIFGSIFAIWFVGKHNLGAAWGEGTELPLFATGINTAVLVASGGTLHWGYLGLKKGNERRFKIGLVLTLLLGAAFLLQQVREYIKLASEGFTIQSRLYGSSFFMLTGTHGAHVAGGLVFLGIVLYRTLKKTQTQKHHLALETAAMYWHFVDVVWLFLFVVVYLKWI